MRLRDILFLFATRIECARMKSVISPIGDSLYYASALRAELSQRNRDFAAQSGAPMCLSRGSAPAVCYAPYGNGELQGNFLPASYRAILKNPAWAKRLNKIHTQARYSLPPNDRGYWNELDSCNSSDALLM